MGMVEIKHFRGRRQHLVEMSGPMAELQLMVADTQVVCSFKSIFLSLKYNYNVRIMWRVWMREQKQANISLPLNDFLHERCPFKGIKTNLTQEGRKKWTGLFEPHELRPSRDLHPVYDW